MPAYKDDNAKGNAWFYTINLKVNGKYVQKRIRGFKTKKLAEAAMVEHKNDMNKGTYIQPSKTLFSEFMSDYLNDKQTTVKKQTLGIYSSLVNNHILPKLGSIELQQLTPRNIQDLYNDLSSAGSLCDENIQKVHSLINEALKKALAWDMVSKNVASLVARPTATKKKMVVWEDEEMRIFLKEAKSSRFYPAYYLALVSGMRQSEILGLTWKDVDFVGNRVSITQTLSHDGKEFNDGAKTDSGSRAVSIDSATMAVLKELKKFRVEEKVAAGPQLYQENSLVVCTAIGTPVNPRNLLRSFEAIVAKCNPVEDGKEIQIRVKKIRFHDLRHTHATMLLKQGVNVKIVSERLGHASVKITLDTYSHVLPSMQKDTAEEFGKLFYKSEDVG
ncbi:site-specific integrase [Paenibacillus psychroresistens]|uniref:Site-specific integrase n=1 Tax=Paenibacillus psychroresistens TaxID=1778678 RepID=A0A6B8RM30_9BACL|nr:site-specific integrase [Paenibacillus psychroresistens]QGQ97079.1 site-specific integrase [Paenibacillus psychroresistens]